MNKVTTILAAIFVVVPLLVTPWALDPFEIDKVIAARIIGAVAFVLLVSKKGTDWMKQLDYKDPGFWLLLFVVWSTVATIFSINPFRSVFGSSLRGGGLLTVICTCGLYVGLRSHGTLSDKAKKLISLMATYTAGVICVLSFMQLYAQNHLYVDVMLITTGAPFQLLRIPGTFGHPLYFGMYLALMIPFMVYAFDHHQKRVHKVLIPTVIALSYVAIYLTRARIAMIAALVIGAIYAITKLKKYKTLIMVNGLVIIIAGLMLSASAQQTIIRPESLFVRWQEWKFAAQTTLDRPFFGYGYETYDEISIARERDPRELHDGLSDRIHNIWLDTAWNTGIPSLVILCALMLSVVMAMKRHNAWERTIGLSLLAYLILMQTSFDMSFTYVLIPFLLAQLKSKKGVYTRNRTIPALLIAMLFVTPAITNAMMFKAKDYLATGEFDKEIALYQRAQSINPTWPELYVGEAESWYARSIVEPENAQFNTQQAETIMKKARTRGLPWYMEASFEVIK